MNQLIPTSLLALGALAFAAPSGIAQGISFSIPGANGYALSTDGGIVAGSDGTGSFIWNPGAGFTYLQGGTGFPSGVSTNGLVVAGENFDAVLLDDAPAYWQLLTDTWTSLGQHPSLNGGCPSFGTATSVSDDGMKLAGILWDGCDTDAFTWTAATGYVVLPDANDSARINAIANDGSWSGGWIQTNSRVAAMWDPAGNLSQPLISAANPSGYGEIFAVDGDGDAFTGWSSGGAFLVRNGVYTDINLAIGSAQSQGSGISSDGRVVGGWSGTSGPFGVQTGMIYTDWSGPFDATAFFAQFGVTPPVGQTSFSEVRDVSGDANSFLAISGGFPFTESVLITLPDNFTSLGGSTTGVAGNPALDGYGWLNPGLTAGLELTDAAPSSLGILAFGGAYNPAPLFGGIVGPVPATGFLVFPTDANGEVDLTFTWPLTAPSGVTLYTQYGVLDGSAVGGVSLSNTLQVTGN